MRNVLLTIAVVVIAFICSYMPYEQIQIACYKLVLLLSGGIVGFFIDVALFPYARPDGYLCMKRDNRYKKSCDDKYADYPVAGGYSVIFAAAMIRRALIICASCGCVAVGL